MTALLGIDCATDPKKTGLALGENRGDVIKIIRCTTGSKRMSPAIVAFEWLREYEDVIIALDAPLGWPKALGTCLIDHKAGEPIQFESNKLFHRDTDTAIRDRLGKMPLEVGANYIARTAVAALSLLNEIRQATGKKIPLAWKPIEKERWRAIEVYPSATRRCYKVLDKGGSLEGLDNLIDYSSVPTEVLKSKDAVDAMVCVLAAYDFLEGRAKAPINLELAVLEGWIWSI